jgi:hypothetical protein
MNPVPDSAACHTALCSVTNTPLRPTLPPSEKGIPNGYAFKSNRLIAHTTIFSSQTFVCTVQLHNS